KAQVAEDDVLDSLGEKRLAAGPCLRWFLFQEVQDHREVVDAERPERVLILPDLAEVLAVAVDVEDVAELVRLDQLLQALDARVVEEQMTRHQHAPALLRGRDEVLDLGAGQRRWLLDE